MKYMVIFFIYVLSVEIHLFPIFLIYLDTVTYGGFRYKLHPCKICVVEKRKRIYNGIELLKGNLRI